ncbi:pitrilysin family protein [Proteinivorax hydrogeniformans]|uniref:Pitrilysin family protein n=1 Tax=Proteinivorax hydrogeniformans TaxID=1826727 RepID=A0AAU8HRD6_9FIRM
MLNSYEYKKIDESYFSFTMPNGLQVFYIPRPNYKKSFAVFSTDFGGIDFKTDLMTLPPGIAHFLEHKLFENPNGNVEDDFSKLGISVNAFTTHNNTSYYISCTSNFYEGLELLLDFVQTPYFTDQNVKKEQGIIAQEIEMYRDDANWVGYLNLLNGLYPNHPINKDIAGAKDDILQVDVDMLNETFGQYYNPLNMALFVIGDIDIERLYEFVAENQQKKKFEEAPKYQRNFKQDEFIPNEKKVSIDMEISRNILNFGFKDKQVEEAGKELFEKEITTLLGLETLVGKSSKLYNDLYENRIIDDSFSIEYTTETGYGHTIFSCETEDPMKTYSILKERFQEAVNQGLDEEDFIVNKRKIQGITLMELNSLENVVLGFMGEHFRGGRFFDKNEIIEKITFEKVEKRIKEHLDFKMSALSVVNNKAR